ncbi:MAG: hypothetical protein HZC42_15015 [Candidatus Eisenbacteria bacterium]|nr:hypothetical protein [Candidatus Eisenbacteria bacterium]
MTRDPAEGERAAERPEDAAAANAGVPQPLHPIPANRIEPPSSGLAAPDADEPPPLLGTWPRVYALVLAVLVLVIAFCFWLSRLGS